ncbi:hypothetical protein DY000_02038750 [Brassica cretica]|uniref:Uncharacterized protein n=1 Tax=Brassica cretica TaxID=69181 RepID=A0ABQ7BRR9_BRACR|nr:hypothetical protein DY000_02038750 [Brassica cretica]
MIFFGLGVWQTYVVALSVTAWDHIFSDHIFSDNIFSDCLKMDLPELPLRMFTLGEEPAAIRSISSEISFAKLRRRSVTAWDHIFSDQIFSDNIFSDYFVEDFQEWNQVVFSLPGSRPSSLLTSWKSSASLI